MQMMRTYVLGSEELAAALFGDREIPPPPEGPLKDEDVLFDLREEAWDLALYSGSKALVFLNAVTGTLEEHGAPENVVRINGWPGMLLRPAIEAAAHVSVRERAEAVLASIGKRVEWVKDVPGMVSARVLAMIINEGYFAEGEQVSDKRSIDIAMQLGTNYPKGPFEWADQVRPERITRLLNKFAASDSRYTVAPTLKNSE